MGEDDDKETPLSDKALERALSRLRHPHPTPFTHNESEDLREMLVEWKYKRRREEERQIMLEERRKRYPWVFAIITICISVVATGVAVLARFFPSIGR